MTWITGSLSAGSAKVVSLLLVDPGNTPSVVLQVISQFLTSGNKMFVEQSLWVFGNALTNNK
jgi:hypothetical protein